MDVKHILCILEFVFWYFSKFVGSKSPLKSPKFNYEKSKKLSKSVISKEFKSDFNQNLSLQDAEPVVYFSSYYNKKSFKDLIPNENDQFSPESSSKLKLEGFIAEQNKKIVKENDPNEDKNKNTKENVSPNLTLLPKSSFISTLKLRKSFFKFHHEKMLSISESLKNKNCEILKSNKEDSESSKNCETDKIELLPCDENTRVRLVILSTLFLAVFVMSLNAKTLNTSHLGAYCLSSTNFVLHNTFSLFQNFFLQKNSTGQECSSCENADILQDVGYEGIIYDLQKTHKNQDPKLWEVIRLLPNK